MNAPLLNYLHALVGSEELWTLWNDEAAWSSLFVDYEHPHVERLSARLHDKPGRPALRVLIHRIHPCEPAQALMHTHPWPSAVHVLSGAYEHITRADDVSSEVLSLLPAGASYQIVSPYVWHSVRPIGSPSCSIMLCGDVWKNHLSPKPPVPQRALTSDEVADMRRVFTDLLRPQ